MFSMGATEKPALRRRLSKDLLLSVEDQDRLEINLSVFDEALTKAENVLKVSIIDDNLPQQNPARKTEADVLEIFVRINTGGTPLSRSDLIFSMLKLNWRESAEALPEFVMRINEGNSFEIDADFVIRCLFAVSDLGTKLDLNLLRRQSSVDKLRANFEDCCDAIRATVDFVRDECWCQSSQLIGGTNTMVPFVYYLFHTRNHEIPNDQIVNARKALYLLGFGRPFSRYADSRPGAFIRDTLKPLIADVSEAFPFESVIGWVRYWERYDNYDESLLQNNYPLALHLVQRRTGAKVQYKRNAPEIDHIFPRSVLRDKGHDESLVNHFANFWILAKGKNQNKSNRHPATYFKDVPASEMKRALIDRPLLDYRRYRKFINTRSQQLLEVVTREVGLSPDDFLTLNGDTDDGH